MSQEYILQIQDLHTHFFIDHTETPAVNGIDLHIEKGETLALVGESGCGKTMTALSILRLVPHPGRIISGKILFNGRNLLELTEKQMQKLRGKEISLIFQEPGLALNPVFTIGNQIAEVIKIHRKEIKDVRKETIRLLELVKIPEPNHRIRAYPHQLSGGMQQRALIAMAIAGFSQSSTLLRAGFSQSSTLLRAGFSQSSTLLRAGLPKLLIADEPTTALDVTIQAQILKLIKELVTRLDMSVLLITHDLGIVAEIADTVAIMYAGRIVEYTNVHEIFKNPIHPYTKGLLESIPRLDKQQKRLSQVQGGFPVSRLREISTGHWAACDII